MNKTRKVRKSPSESATSLPEGTMKQGWVIKKASNGVPRWVPNTSVELNGFRLFTTDYAAKHIGKKLKLYTREFKDTWPKKSAWSKPEDSTYQIFTFVPNGDAIKEKTKIEGWLKTQKPAIKKDSHFYLDGPVYLGTQYLADGLPVDSRGGKIVSYNLLNTETFVRE